MKSLVGVIIVTMFGVGAAFAGSYSIESTMSAHKQEGTYLVEARISELVMEKGKLIENVLSKPRITSTPGVPASLYVGPDKSDLDYARKENISMEVSWPYPNETGMAMCEVAVKRGDTLLFRSKANVKLEGPGRNPLVLTLKEVDPNSVKVTQEKGNTYLLLNFTGKTKEEVKRLVNENYGNKVQVPDPKGPIIDGGVSSGGFQELGMALHYPDKEKAAQVASVLRGKRR